MRIGEFLLRRLSELGITAVFGVPGDYNMSFLEQLEERPDISWIGACNELNAAYAADGYARAGRPGVLLTTYGVGCLSALNGVAGAYCEHIPLIHISGSPPAHAVADRISLHHSLLDGGYRNVHRAFSEFTEYGATISAGNAVDVIDQALLTAVRTHRPVRLELPSDLTHVRIAVPQDALVIPEQRSSERQLLDAVTAVANALKHSMRPVLIFDLPAVRVGALGAIESFCAATNIPYFCTGPAMHQADPAAGTYLGVLSAGGGDRSDIFTSADLLLTCGLTISDVTTGGFALDLISRQSVRLSTEYTRVETPDGPAVFYSTTIADVLNGVMDCKPAAREGWSPAPPTSAPITDVDQTPLTETYFFARLQSFVRPGDVLIAETGTSGQNTVGLSLPENVRYINQSSWGSIGYALPAMLGALVADPDRRHILCTGDGSLQVTVQELSTVIRHGFTPVIFLLNNRGYTIERSILGATSAYNDIADWNYRDLPKAFGIDDASYLAQVCHTRAELEAALTEVDGTSRLSLIEVALEPMDMTPTTAAIGASMHRYDYGVYSPQR